MPMIRCTPAPAEVKPVAYKAMIAGGVWQQF